MQQIKIEQIKLDLIENFHENFKTLSRNFEKLSSCRNNVTHSSDFYSSIDQNFSKYLQLYKKGECSYGLERYFQNKIIELLELNFTSQNLNCSIDHDINILSCDYVIDNFLIRLCLNELRTYLPNFLYTYMMKDNKIYSETTCNTMELKCFIEECNKKCNELNLYSIFLQYENAMNIAHKFFRYHNISFDYRVKYFKEPIEIPIYVFKHETYYLKYIKTHYLLLLNPNNSCAKFNNFHIGKNFPHKKLCALETTNMLNMMKGLEKYKIQIKRSMCNKYKHQISVNLLMENCLPMVEELKPIMKFCNNILIIGCGSVARCTLPILIKSLDLNCNQITMIDFVDNRNFVMKYIEQGLEYVQIKITPENYKQLLCKYLKSGDLLLDLAWNIETIDLIRWCNENNVLFCNTSVEEWDPYEDLDVKDPREITLYYKQLELIESAKNNKTTALVDAGCNPGMVNVIIKKGIEDVAFYLVEKGDLELRTVENLIREKNYPKLAQTIGLQVIHISERDTQISCNPKKVDEFVGTWSVEGLREEASALSELGYGTHEKKIPKNAILNDIGPKNSISLSSMGMNTVVRSYVPGSQITGYVIRHGESVSMSRSLTNYENGKAVYRPSVYYAYCPCDATINSLKEFKMHSYNSDYVCDRIMYDEIIDGYDAVGCLLMGPKFGSWWIGSILDIHQTRQILGKGHNPTVLQVAAHLVSAVTYCIKNPELGLIFPDDLEHNYIIKNCIHLLGDFISKKVNWDPLITEDDFLTFGNKKPDQEDKYQFQTFLVNNNTYRMT